MFLFRCGFFLCFLSLSVFAQSNPELSFDQSYHLLEKKIDALKDKGEKVGDQSRKELEDLMVQMNHQHSELKRELEKKNQEMNQKLEETKQKEASWEKRANGAYAELKAGFEKAWAKLKQGDQ